MTTAKVAVIIAATLITLALLAAAALKLADRLVLRSINRDRAARPARDQAEFERYADDAIAALREHPWTPVDDLQFRRETRRNR